MRAAYITTQRVAQSLDRSGVAVFSCCRLAQRFCVCTCTLELGLCTVQLSLGAFVLLFELRQLGAHGAELLGRAQEVLVGFLELRLLLGELGFQALVRRAQLGQLRSRALDVSIRNRDSGVVIRMSAASRRKRRRSSAGVSPVRTPIAGTWSVSPRAWAMFAMPASGARRFRSTSTASAFSGETYRTRHRSPRGGGGENMSRLRHQRNAASVLPLPVGARISVDSPRAIAGQPRFCGAVGSAKTAPNHSATAGWKSFTERSNYK